MSHSTLSLSKSTYLNFGLNHIKVATVVYSDPDTDTSRLNNQTRFFTLLSSDLKPDITITMPRNIIILSDLDHYLFKLEDIIRSDKVDEDRISEVSGFRNQTHMVTVDSCHKLMPSPCTH